MNTSVNRYPAKEIVSPAGLKKAEICSRSGLLATDKCYDTVKNGADTVRRRTTYVEIGTAAQLPTELCNVHGEPHAQLVRESTESEFPRAAPAVDLNEIRPVIAKGPTLLADKDPYNSAKATAKPTPPPEAEIQRLGQVVEKKAEVETPQPGAIIPKAIPVQSPVEEPLEIRKAVPVGPLDEVEDETLLKSATPPPTDLDGEY